MQQNEQNPFVRRCSACGALNRVPAGRLADTGRCGSCKASLPPLSEPLEVDSGSFDQIAKAAKVPVLVDMWAPWCGPCRISAPDVRDLAREMAGRAIVLKVNTDAQPDLAARFNIQSIPTFLVLNQGRIALQRSGVAPKAEMKRWIESQFLHA